LISVNEKSVMIQTTITSRISLIRMVLIEGLPSVLIRLASS
jgi:hypothetical protein